jgi:MFS family permease
MVARLVPAKRRAEGMGYFGVSISLALCLGPLGGTFGMEYFGFPITLLCAGVLMLFCFYWLMLLPSWKPLVAVPAIPFSLNRFIETSVWFPSLLCGIIGLSFGSVGGYITLWGKSVGISNVGGFFLLNAVFSLLVRLFAGRVADSMGRKFIILPSGLIFGISLVILMMCNSYTGMIIAAICMGIGLGSIYPTLQAWVIDLCPPERRGAATAFYYNSFDLGMGISMVAWGKVASLLGFSYMYGIAAIAMVLFMVLYIGHLYKEKNRRRACDPG